ncbi:hypothetical protein [Halorientalis sp. IM1011]|uniref:hypothetical protein n=1 Tax=Halorientalis sp. IM1011 TaxID=1932360 RepID=UPI0012FAAE00|nr:hypothetical protein [Halorientalis sp. IM1011]
MVHVTRRQALQLSGCAVVAGLAGCGVLNRDSTPSPTLGEIGVTNLDFRPHTVSVLILDEGEPVYSAEMDVAAAKPEVDDSTDVATAGSGSFEGFPTKVEGSVLYAWRDRQPVSKWEKFDFQDKTTSCLGLNVHIGDVSQSRPGDVSILYTTNSDTCKDAATAISADTDG